MGGSFMQNEQQILLEHLAKDSDLAYTLLYKQFYVPMVLFASKYINNDGGGEGCSTRVLYFHVGTKKRIRECYSIKSLSL